MADQDRSPNTAAPTPIREKTMRCAMCGQVKNWHDGFPMTIYAECWKCVWERHCALQHKPKRRWHLRWPIFRDPVSEDENGRRNFHEDREAKVPESAASTERDLDEAHDWLIAFVSACDMSAVGHYWHMCDGKHRTCGCKWEGNDDPR